MTIKVCKQCKKSRSLKRYDAVDSAKPHIKKPVCKKCEAEETK